MQVTKQGRQGDVPFHRRKALPASAKPVARDVERGLVLAYGEVTGHAHVFHDPNVCGFSTLESGEIDFIVVSGSGATLRHDKPGGAQADHDPIFLEPGVYELPVQVEHQPKQAPRVVAD